MKEILKTIEAKIALNMPLTEYEKAVWILYGGEK